MSKEKMVKTAIFSISFIFFTLLLAWLFDANMNIKHQVASCITCTVIFYLLDDASLDFSRIFKGPDEEDDEIENEGENEAQKGD